MKKVALDVDGVLANFYLAICKKFNKPYKSIATWGVDWIHENFSKIADDKEFWLSLPVLNPPESITFDFECYMTSIPEEMKEIRELWLKINGFPDKPVIVSENKLQTCLDLGIDILVDDKPSTVAALKAYKKVDGDKIIEIEPLLFVPQYFLNSSVEGVYSITHLDEVNTFL